MALLAIFHMTDQSILALVCINLFIMSFQFSQGPIVCMYPAEVAVDSAMGIVYFFLFLTMAILTLSIEFIVHSQMDPHGLFFMLSGTNLIGAVFMKVYLKETKGLTDVMKKALYVNK